MRVFLDWFASHQQHFAATRDANSSTRIAKSNGGIEECVNPNGVPGLAKVRVGALLLVSFLCAECLAQPQPQLGEQIFAKHCATCHGEHGEGISSAVTIAGPSLKAEHEPGKVMTAVETGPEHMPQFEYVLSVDDMHAVSQFVVEKLANIPLSGGELGRGGVLYRANCSSCHRTAVRGGALAFVGVNAPALTDKSAALIAGAIRWGPGPMPAFPPTVLDDKQVASIVDYIRTVQHPPRPGGWAMKWYGPVSEGYAAWIIVLALTGITAWIEKGGKG